MLQKPVFQVADALSGVFAPSRGPLSADQLIALARRRTGLTEFGGAPFMDPLQKFLCACFEEADLSLVGRIGEINVGYQDGDKLLYILII